MFCVIQEVTIKRIPKGEPKGIEVYESTWGFNRETYTNYNYRYSEENFERTVKKRTGSVFTNATVKREK